MPNMLVLGARWISSHDWHLDKDGTISSSRGIIPTRGSNLCLLHWQVDSLPLCHLGSPKKCDIFFSQNERKKYDHFHDTKKAFDKIQHPFMVKTLNKFGTEGTSLKKIKLYRTSPELILHMWRKEKDWKLSSEIRNKTGMPTVNHCYSTQSWKLQPE